jgi:hypothetical protein
VVISRSAFASNNATGGDGGQGYTGGANMEQGLPGGNGGGAGSGAGGALFNSGTASLVNCTIAVNTGRGGDGGAGGQGGGGYVHFGGNGGDGGSGGNAVGGLDGTCNLTNCTLAWNAGMAGSGGPGGPGGMGQFPGTPGAAGSGGAASGATTYLPMVNSLVASNTPAGTDTFTDPKLGPLADNGGPTLTVALLPGSPAIDAGEAGAAPTTDQRGYPRPAGLAADLGAFEYGSMLPDLTITKSGGTTVDILARGNAGASCRLQMSANFTDWQCVATNHFGPDGTAHFPASCGTCATHQFYQVASP